MAYPIQSIPILYDEDAERFWKELEESEKLPKQKLVYPDISKVIELIRRRNIDERS